MDGSRVQRVRRLREHSCYCERLVGSAAGLPSAQAAAATASPSKAALSPLWPPLLRRREKQNAYAFTITIAQ